MKGNLGTKVELSRVLVMQVFGGTSGNGVIPPDNKEAETAVEKKASTFSFPKDYKFKP